MNYLKKTVIFALLSGLMIGTTQANMDEEIESLLGTYNRMTIWGTKMRTQDILLHGPLSIFASGLGIAFFRRALTNDYSMPRNMGKSFNHPLEDVIIGCIVLTLGIAGLGLIYHKAKAIQAENQ